MNIDLREARIAAEQLRDRMMLLKRMIMGEVEQRPADDPIRVPTPGSCSPSARGSTRPGGTTPPAPSARGSTRPGGTTPPAPSYGFHNPAPATARQIPAQAVAPDAARKALEGIIAELRGTAAALHAAGAHLLEAASALEGGRRAAAVGSASSAKRAPLPHGGRRPPPARVGPCICTHPVSEHASPGPHRCTRCDCPALRQTF